MAHSCSISGGQVCASSHQYFFSPVRIFAIDKKVKLDIFGQEIELSDFQEILQKEVANLENTLADIFPPEKSNRYMPLTAEPTVAYYVHAVEFLDTLKVDIRNSAAWNAVGHYYFPTDTEKSRKCYEKAIEKSPDDPNSRANLGIWYLLHNDLYMAKDVLEKSIQLSEKQKVPAPWAYVGLAAVYQYPFTRHDQAAIFSI